MVTGAVEGWRRDVVMGLACCWIALFWLLCAVVPSASEDLLLGYLTGSQRLEGDLDYPRPGLTISGAISLAVDELNRELLAQKGHNLSFLVRETYGDETISIRETAALWTKNITAYIGPQETCVHEAKMAAAFNLAMISYFCTNYETSNKREFPTFARTRPPDTQISKSVASVLLAFNWTQVTFFYLNASDSELGTVADTILNVFEEFGIRVLRRSCWETPYFHGYMENPFHRLVAETYAHTRIYVILGEHSEHIGLVAAMEERNLFDNGEYWVVGVDIEQYDEDDPAKYVKGLLQDKIDPVALRGFRSYLGVLPSPPRGFRNFSLLVNAYMERPPFSYPNPVGYLGGVKQIRAEAAYLYDAVKLYTYAFLETLEAGENPRNGTAVVNRLRQRHYHSAMGYMVYMDNNGDAEGNYTLLGLKSSPEGQYGMHPVGVFTYGHSDSSLPELHLNSEIQWINGVPPIAEPPCGFTGEKCITHTMEIAGGIAGAGLAIIVLVTLVLYRNWQYEQELDSLLWKVDFKEIQMNDSDIYNQNSPGAKVTTKVTHPLIRTSQVSLSSNPDADFRYSMIYTPVGIYRGRVLAIKKVSKKSIDITREMKKNLKVMRDLRHDNLNAFIGACTDPPNICIVTEYCTRGSLKDILENEDVKLDNMFIASLVGDILRGLIYLQDSPLRYHGNLKASNCLVDSRWVVKLADFGLKEFKSGADNYHQHWSLAHLCDDLYKCGCEGLLYRAPELLRITTSTTGVGSQKGDVYAFGIILYELHSRRGPFGDTTGLSVQQILEKVMYPSAHSAHPFRPPLELLENSFDFVRDCLKECWQENPDDRPDIKTLRTKLRPMRKGMKPNIFDNMIAMMEKYANNLEALVDERTDQLVEEKKKTEALLYEMLPRYVAEQLKRGNKVEAESFDSVTIYFSDIVGFTTMSAQSTPLQVVDFLNDLYTCFDSTIETYDVYKVETIGDAYMVVSGLPVRNGDQHAAEIATLSLDMLEAVRKFTIRHRPYDKLKLRIGIHSGPVCAGVVGQKMPRYCLFGDTVNTASRMESTGEALKIHCSITCKQLLDRLRGYRFEERGLIDLKGKGEMRTYFLVSEEPEWRLKRKIDRENRRAEGRQGKLLKNSKENGQPPGAPRSSLKNKPPISSPLGLSRCASFESPKRLRFATNHTVEFNPYQRTKLEAIADNSPGKRKQSGGGGLLLLEAAEFGDQLSASCPSIENALDGSPEKLAEANSDPALFALEEVDAPLLSQPHLSPV